MVIDHDPLAEISIDVHLLFEKFVQFKCNPSWQCFTDREKVTCFKLSQMRYILSLVFNMG